MNDREKFWWITLAACFLALLLLFAMPKISQGNDSCDLLEGALTTPSYTVLKSGDLIVTVSLDQKGKLGVTYKHIDKIMMYNRVYVLEYDSGCFRTFPIDRYILTIEER